MFSDNNILIIGDVMLDTYLMGTVDRVSPEAPVPVVNIQNTENKLGGAANVALNIKQLGSTPIICSIVGNDRNAENLKKLLNEYDISTDFILSSNYRKTTNKTRVIGNNHQLVRYDDEVIDDLNYNDYTNLCRNLEIIFEKKDIDVILIQDYDKGVIDRNLIDKIIKLADVEKIPVIVDPKKRNFDFYRDVKLIKPNLKELKEGLRLFDLNKEELLEVGSKKLHEKGIEIVFVTLGGEGIYVSYDKGETAKIVPGIKRYVSDVSGAGDTVISIISTLINMELSVDRMAEISNVAGGIVCEHIGVIPIDKEKLMDEI